MGSLRIYLLVAAVLCAVAVADAKRKIKRDELESLRSVEEIEEEDEEEFDEVTLSMLLWVLV